jgi:hypothetical protein
MSANVEIAIAQPPISREQVLRPRFNIVNYCLGADAHISMLSYRIVEVCALGQKILLWG